MNWRAVTAGQLPDLLAAWLAESPARTRVAVDGPECSPAHELAASLIEPLRLRGRPAAHVSAGSFWCDASLRLEFGREDVGSFPSWLDADALRREVLDPFAQRGEYLPSLRDPATNRATREPRVAVAADAVLLVSGPLLLGRGLPFDRTVHLTISPDARRRRTPSGQAWTLPAYDDYDSNTRPGDLADVVIRMDHPDRPAIHGLEPSPN